MSIEIRNFLPKKSDINISTATDISFDLVGLDGDLIDILTLSVEIEMASNVIPDEINTVVYDFGVDPNLKQISYVGDSVKKNFYKIQVIPDFPFDENQSVTIKVNVDTTTAASMVEYETDFVTTNNGIFTDFKFAFINSAMSIPVYAEILSPNNSTSPNIFHSAFQNWNIKPRTIVRRNQLIIDSGFTIDYKNGQILINNSAMTHGPIDYADQIDVDYTFGFFSEEEIKSFFRQAVSIWRMSPPYGGPADIFSTSETHQQVMMIGAAMLAYRQLLLGLTIQEKRIIFDNESWNTGWQQAKDIFKESYDSYKDMWEKLLEAKKLTLPNIATIVVPEYTLPGGRTLFSDDLCCISRNNYVNFDTIFNMMMEGRKVNVLTFDIENKFKFSPISCIEYEGKKEVYSTEIFINNGKNLKVKKINTSLDHKYDTPNGMKRLKTLNKGDKVFVKNEDFVEKGVIGEIGYLGFEKCYEIEVPKYHKFLCNDISVSNSRFFRYMYK